MEGFNSIGNLFGDAKKKKDKEMEEDKQLNFALFSGDNPFNLFSADSEDKQKDLLNKAILGSANAPKANSLFTQKATQPSLFGE